MKLRSRAISLSTCCLCFIAGLASAATLADTSSQPRQELDIVENSLGMEFVRIQAGKFTMGSDPKSHGHEADETLREITITKDFYLQTTPVTQGQWLALIDGSPSAFPECGDNCPVDGLKPEWVEHYIGQLNALEPGAAYRLPTEAEWEYAARAGTATLFHTGDCLQPGQANVSEGRQPMPDCEPHGNSAGPSPVKQFEANPWGLYDMAGNVWELCQDWYGDYDLTDLVDPQGPPSGEYRVLRGGSWRFYPTHARSANRFRNTREIAGFRLVLVKGKGESEPQKP